MSRLLKVVMIGVIAALLVAPAAAQDDGNIIIDSTFGASGPINFNPVTSSSADEQQIMGLLYPALVGVNPETALIEPGAPGGMAESWDVSEDGSVYTFHLRDDLTWTDGSPVVAQDFGIVWDVIQSGQVETPLGFITENVADIEVIDDHTLKVTFNGSSCEALWDVGFQPIPAHLYTDGDYSVLSTQNYDTPEALEIGPYQLSSQIPDQQTALTPVEGFPDGEAVNDGYVYKLVADQTVQVEQFLAGETDVFNGPPENRRADLVAAADQGIVTYDYSPGNSYDYLAFNQANPDNPQEAYDEAGNLIEQDPHPIFGDVRVRQALSMAVNVDEIIEGATFGYGTRMASSYAQGTWPYDASVPTYDYDTEAAVALLEEAGWIDDDNDPTTPRIAQGALYAEDGTELRFDLVTNQGNTRREAVGQIVQDQLADIGVAVDFQTIDFNVLIEQMDAQNFDATILGWQNGYPFRADQTQLWATSSDEFGGSNFTSYINPEIDELLQQALYLPGCDIAGRAALYGQVQEILHRDAPYLFLYSRDGMYAWHDTVNGVDPYPAALYWNITEWTKAP
jgi:peptide/nickel transport system substrate-binding protein